MSKTEKSNKPAGRKSTSDSLEIVRRFYPKALPMDETIDRAYKILKDNFKLEPEQIMRADCTCADDVNAIQEPENFKEMYGPFKMGGLNGFPFTGAVGMGAYSHHVIEDGALFIYYGPHVGVGKDSAETGKIGKIIRIGQTEPSSSCGAAIAALNNLKAGTIELGKYTQLDFQFNTIEQIFLSGGTRILKDKSGKDRKDPLKEATDVMYEAIEERMNLHFDKTDFEGAHCKYVVLLGGILINGDGKESFNDCRRFDVYDVAEKKWKSFLKSFYP